jgi:hypothetical protein
VENLWKPLWEATLNTEKIIKPKDISQVSQLKIYKGCPEYPNLPGKVGLRGPISSVQMPVSYSGFAHN